MYGLSDADLEIQARAATFADELIPLEVEAELNGGELPKELTAGHAARARSWACARRTCPPSWAAWATPRCSRSWSRSRSAGSPTRWPGSAPRRRPGCPRWRPPSSWRSSSGPTIRGRARGVLRDHRGGRRVGRRRHRGDRPPGRRRLRAQRREVARDLVQQRRLRVLPGQADRRRARRRARDVPGRPAQPGRPGGPHPGVLAHASATTTRSWRSRTCGCRRRTWSAPRATG